MTDPHTQLKFAQLALHMRIDIAFDIAKEQREKFSEILFQHMPATHPARGVFIDAYHTHGVQVLRDTIKANSSYAQRKFSANAWEYLKASGLLVLNVTELHREFLESRKFAIEKLAQEGLIFQNATGAKLGRISDAPIGSGMSGNPWNYIYVQGTLSKKQKQLLRKSYRSQDWRHFDPSAADKIKRGD